MKFSKLSTFHFCKSDSDVCMKSLFSAWMEKPTVCCKHNKIKTGYLSSRIIRAFSNWDMGQNLTRFKVFVDQYYAGYTEKQKKGNTKMV